MRRKLLLLIVPLLFLMLAAGSLFFGRDRFDYLLPRPDLWRHSDHDEHPSTTHIPSDGRVLPAAVITEYLDAIFKRKETKLPDLKCPVADLTRYEALKVSHRPEGDLRYFFALDLRQSLPLLPQLIGSIVQAIRFLGPAKCALSIIEGNSDDGTADVLEALRPDLETMGVSYWVQSSSIDPSKDDRIGRLAELRNLAIEPVFDNARASHETTIIFINDVALCSDDILELLFQKRHLGADMTCAMDWTYVGHDPTFYDVWVARGINGDSFFNIPSDGSWDFAWNLFWNEAETQQRFFRRKPFQVFSCWNGATAFSARPLLDENVRIRFRKPDEAAGECQQGEPQLFCKDLWFHGFGKIAVVPAVNLEYSVDNGKRIKEAKGFTAENVAGQALADDQIEWQLDAPKEVKCMPSWTNQFWQPWNATLTS